MNTRTGILFVFLIVALAIQGFSQDSNTSKTEKKPQSDATQEETRSDGLRKITTRSSRNWNFDVRIDEKALEENIERAINQAMKSVEGTLERLEINIEPIEINMKDLNVDVNPILVNLPRLNIDIDPIEVELPDLDIEAHMNHHDFDRDDDHDNAYSDDDDDDKVRRHDKDKDKDKNKDKVKDKSDKSDKKDKEKSKGLKKLN